MKGLTSDRPHSAKAKNARQREQEPGQDQIISELQWYTRTVRNSIIWMMISHPTELLKILLHVKKHVSSSVP